MFLDNRFQQSMFVYRLETYSSKFIHLSHFYLCSCTYMTKNMFLEGCVYCNWSKKVSSFSVMAPHYVVLPAAFAQLLKYQSS